MTMTSPTKAERRAAKLPDPDRVSFGALIAWSSSHASTAAAFLILGYFTLYCTDTLGLSPAIVGTLLFISKVIDAAGVLFAGWLIDISPETRWGKARPYDLAVIGVWAFTAAMYSTPGAWGDTAKYVWVFVTYLLITAVFMPLFNANQPLYMARAFGTRDAFTKVSARSGIIIGLTAVIAGATFPIMLDQVGKSPAGWSQLILLYAVPLVLFGLVRFVVVREKHTTEVPGLPKVRLDDIKTVLTSNPYLWSVAGIQFVVAVVGNLGVLSYFYRYVVGSLALAGILGVLNLVLIPVLAVLPPLVRKFSVSKLIAFSGGFGAAGFLVYSFAGSNIALLVAAGLLTACSAMPISFLLPILVIDNATYNEWKGNRRLESVSGGVTAFAQNLGAGVSAAMAGIVLSFVGYDGTKDVQTPEAMTGIIALNSWIPAALSIAAIFVALAYHKFEKRLPEITAEVEARREAVAATVAVPVATTATGLGAPLMTGTEPLEAAEQDELAADRFRNDNS